MTDTRLLVPSGIMNGAAGVPLADGPEIHAADVHVPAAVDRGPLGEEPRPVDADDAGARADAERDLDQPEGGLGVGAGVRRVPEVIALILDHPGAGLAEG